MVWPLLEDQQQQEMRQIQEDDGSQSPRASDGGTHLVEGGVTPAAVEEKGQPGKDGSEYFAPSAVDGQDERRES